MQIQRLWLTSGLLILVSKERKEWGVGLEGKKESGKGGWFSFFFFVCFFLCEMSEVGEGRGRGEM